MAQSADGLAHQPVPSCRDLDRPPALGHARGFRGHGLLQSTGCCSGESIGSEFLPHLDEGSLWVRGTLAPSTGPTEGIRLTNQARMLLCSFPEATTAPAKRDAQTTEPIPLAFSTLSTSLI